MGTRGDLRKGSDRDGGEGGRRDESERLGGVGTGRGDRGPRGGAGGGDQPRAARRRRGRAETSAAPYCPLRPSRFGPAPARLLRRPLCIPASAGGRDSLPLARVPSFPRASRPPAPAAPSVPTLKLLEVDSPHSGRGRESGLLPSAMPRRLSRPLPGRSAPL